MKSTAVTVNTGAGQVIVILGPNGAAVDPDSCVIAPEAANSGTVYIGGIDVTTANGYPLTATSPALSIDAVSTETVYATAGADGQKLRILKKYKS